MAKRRRDPSKPPPDPRPPLARPVVEAYLTLPATMKWAQAHAAGKVAEQDAEDLANAAIAEAWASKWAPSAEAALPAWLRTITDRTIAHHYKKQKSRARFEGELPASTTRVDEAGLPVGEDEDDSRLVDADPRSSPETDDVRAEGWLFKRWFEDNVDDPRDRETFAIMLEWAESDDATYQDLAEARGISLAALTQRVFKLKKEVLPRYAKYRDKVMPWFWVGGALAAGALVALGMYLWAHRDKTEPIAPGPPLQWVVPSASAPPVETFDQAQPTPPPVAPSVPIGPRVPAPRLRDKP